MKTMSSLAKKALPEFADPQVVHYIAIEGGWRRLKEPVLSSEIDCPSCAFNGHFTPFIDPKYDNKRVRICGNGGCETNKNLKRPTKENPDPKPFIYT